MLEHTLAEAERLGLGVDMATGTGWPFGGPWVGNDVAPRSLAFKTWTVAAGGQVPEPIRLVQAPLVRAVGNQIHVVNEGAPGDPPRGVTAPPVLRADARAIQIGDLVEPVSANPNLQALALEQVKFPRDLPLTALIAYGENGAVLDLTSQVTRDRVLAWTAPAGTWTLYALFAGWHGKMVERAAPGGEGHRHRSLLAGGDPAAPVGVRSRVRRRAAVRASAPSSTTRTKWTMRPGRRTGRRRCSTNFSAAAATIFAATCRRCWARTARTGTRVSSPTIGRRCRTCCSIRFTPSGIAGRTPGSSIVRNQAHGSPAQPARSLRGERHSGNRRRSEIHALQVGDVGGARRRAPPRLGGSGDLAGRALPLDAGAMSGRPSIGSSSPASTTSSTTAPPIHRRRSPGRDACSTRPSSSVRRTRGGTTSAR